MRYNQRNHPDYSDDRMQQTQPLPQPARDPQYPSRPPQHRRRSPVKWILLVLLILILAAALFAARLLTCYNYDDTNASDLTITDNVVNIALFGVDTRENQEEAGTRADAIMIMSVNNSTGKIKLVSLMRDSYVNVPGYGMTKLCHSYSYGGPQLAMQTINEDFGTNISEYITVNFGEMASIISSVGGVKINVTKAERKETNKFIKEYCKANGLSYKKNKIKKSGEQMLNGVQAMTYGRIRKGSTGGDWSRTERQSAVLEQVFARATSGNPVRFIGFLNGLMPNVTTSLSQSDFVKLGLHTIKGGMPDMEHARLPLDGEWQYSTTADGMSVITFRDDVLAQHLQEYLYKDADLVPVT